MGKIFEKDGHLYEEGFLLDRDLGELHENLDGSRETRNVFDTNYSLKPDDSFAATMGPIFAGPLAPLCDPPDHIVTKSDGETGRMKYDNWRGRREYCPDKPEPQEDATVGDKGGYYDSHTGSSRGEYKAGGHTPAQNNLQEQKNDEWGLLDYALAIGAAVLVVAIISGKKK